MSDSKNKTSLIESIAQYTIWAMLCLSIIPVSALPSSWQYQIMVILVLAFVISDLLFERTKKVIDPAFFRYFMVLVTYFSIVLLILNTGGIQSDYFFLLYVLAFISSFTISLAGVVILINCLLLSLGIDTIVVDYDFENVDLMALALKIVSLIALSPLVLYLVSRYNEVESRSQNFDQTQQLLKLHEASGQILLNVISAGVMMIDKNFSITFMSLNAERQFSLKTTEVQGKNIFSVFHFFNKQFEEGNHLELEIKETLLQDKEKISFQCNMKNLLNQKEYDMLINGQPLLDDSGDMVSAMIIFEDREKRENMRQMYNRMQEITIDNSQ